MTRWLSMILAAGCLTGLVAAGPAFAERQVTDQAGRVVTLPDRVERVVTLQHQTLDVLIELNAQDKLVGILRDWDKYLPSTIAEIAPVLRDLPMPGDLRTVNAESVAGLRPDVVFVTHYMKSDVVEQIERLGIPVVKISFFTGPKSEQAKLNPSLDDETKAYTDGLVDAVRLIGAVVGRDKEAGELVDYALAERELVNQRTAQMADAKRTTMYMANPELATYGSGKYTGVAMRQAGGLNVAREIDGYGKVSMEQVLQWNPQVIVVQARYASVAEEIRKDRQWQVIDAVKSGRVFVAPEYVKPWGHPLPESVALGELWMAKKLHPALFEDIDMAAKAESFYRRFYRQGYKGM
ncbi:ABC transporter substrate-binding protein [Pelagibius sp. CAU 1746]|uniref:ABC transporter substrate-binding protein n=1 Tax=Pelagibius sp. CAU 1746 TaxID=3140370 RepID=UPI00325B78F2